MISRSTSFTTASAISTPSPFLVPIAEAGANPITQLAFTLANAFTYVEAYLARGMQIDDFAPNLSFFFSNEMSPSTA